MRRVTPRCPPRPSRRALSAAFPSISGSDRSTAGDAHVTPDRWLRVVAIDNEIMPLRLAGDGGVERLVQKLVRGRRAQRRAQIGRILLAKAQVKRSGASHAHAIAAFAKIMGERGDEAQTAPGFRDMHIAGGATGAITGLAQGEALLEPRLDQA